MSNRGNNQSRNKFNLKIQAVPQLDPIPDKQTATDETDMAAVREKLADLQISPTEREQLEDFLKHKKELPVLSSSDLEQMSVLGSGNSGVVTKVKHTRTNIVMARKMIHLEVKPAIILQILRELKILHSCNSPYIVGFWGAFQAENEINICMEYMNGGSLDLIMRKSGRIHENVLARISLGVLKGLKYLRDEKAIIHRDVKPSNILVNTKGDIKLCDFGVSGQLINSMANSFVGTRSYMSPERLQGTKYNIVSDIWSYGLSLIEMAYGKYPIPPPSEEDMEELMSATGPVYPSSRASTNRGDSVDDNSPKTLAIFELLDYIVNEPPPTLPAKYFTETFIEFVNKCLVKDPKDRATLTFLMSHQFVTSDKVISLEDFISWITKHGIDNETN
ncbi:dual specificity mitogen-activated protein kinase kinase 1-like [Symsagittifera roscoffensis]|uniref:dual specificity mitogen-activated protein kinase kinase 1-like n=1 Tax=Symsagittifera roscoffensis TaxID=84072 RepID=UPI00307BA773